MVSSLKLKLYMKSVMKSLVVHPSFWGTLCLSLFNYPTWTCHNRLSQTLILYWFVKLRTIFTMQVADAYKIFQINQIVFNFNLHHIGGNVRVIIWVTTKWQLLFRFLTLDRDVLLVIGLEWQLPFRSTLVLHFLNKFQNMLLIHIWLVLALL